jgi:prepilin-type processing-associated H-X9-DG protein
LDIDLPAVHALLDEMLPDAFNPPLREAPIVILVAAAVGRSAQADHQTLAGKENEATQATTKPESQQELMVLKQEDREKNDEPRKDSDRKSDKPGDRIRSANNLRQIGQAIHNYLDHHGQFPPPAILSKDGKALLSWRVAILPWLQQDALYQAFKLDEPWDSEHNKKLLAQMPPVYAPLGGDTEDNSSTFYRVFVGKGTIFDPTVKKVTVASVSDGCSNTLMVVEAGQAVAWTKPEDLSYDPEKRLAPLGGMFKGGFNILMADGSAHFIKADFDEKKLRLLITRDDGQPIDLDDLMK